MVLSPPSQLWDLVGTSGTILLEVLELFPTMLVVYRRGTKICQKSNKTYRELLLDAKFCLYELTIHYKKGIIITYF